jgi:hypothetical protein
LEYPFRHTPPDTRRNLISRFRTWYETARITRREKRDLVTVELLPQRDVVPLKAEDIPLVFTTHNDMAILPFFLRHYRQLGVTRFICVDDVSKDGTREFLKAQPNVDLWTSPIRFGEARRGRRWREALFARYGYNRWYLNVDSDEFLLYDDWESKALPALIGVLDAQGLKRLPCPMLDMYPASDDGQSLSSDGMPWDYSRLFDGTGYACSLERRGISIRGGPRRRRFQEENQLIKYPVIYWDQDCLFGSSLHQPLPYGRNFGSTWGALLHFKFFTNYRDKIAEAAEGKQHYNNSEHYTAMMAELQTAGGIDLADEVSIPFKDAQQLVELGFMTSIDYRR